MKKKYECIYCNNIQEIDAIPTDYRFHTNGGMIRCKKCKCITQHKEIKMAKKTIVKEKTLEEKVKILSIEVKGIKQQLKEILNDLASKKWGK